MRQWLIRTLMVPVVASFTFLASLGQSATQPVPSGPPLPRFGSDLGTAPPTPPKPLTLPEMPIQAAASNGYLPASWQVTPGGEFTYAIPLDVPAGRAGMQPNLTLTYSSNGGNGVLGVGWSISGLPSITRCGSTLATEGHVDGVDFSARDRYCLNGQ